VAFLATRKTLLPRLRKQGWNDSSSRYPGYITSSQAMVSPSGSRELSTATSTDDSSVNWASYQVGKSVQADTGGAASGARTAFVPSRATPEVSVPGAIETLDEPDCPVPLGPTVVKAGGTMPVGGARFAPMGTVGPWVVVAGASDAGLPSSAVADSVCAVVTPTQSDSDKANPIMSAQARVSFKVFSTSDLLGEVCDARLGRSVHHTHGRQRAMQPLIS